MNISEDLLNNVFNYTVKTNEEKENDKFDPTKIQYNNLYKSVEYFEKKFAPGYQNIPGFSEVIETIAKNNYDNSPLKEYEKRLY
jgi:hypothetical protein